MKVYIVMETYEEAIENMFVFRSRDKAMEKIEKMKSKFIDDNIGSPYKIDNTFWHNSYYFGGREEESWQNRSYEISIRAKELIEGE